MPDILNAKGILIRLDIVLPTYNPLAAPQEKGSEGLNDSLRWHRFRHCGGQNYI